MAGATSQCPESGQYQFPTAHAGKSETFRRVAPKAVVDLLTLGGAFGRRQGPDLFVYSEDERPWFFAEVKGPGDTVSNEQKELFAEIERRSGGKDVVLVRTVAYAGANSRGAPNNALHRTAARVARSGR